MKSKPMIHILVIAVALVFAPTTLLATSKDEATLKAESAQISQQIEQALDQVNESYSKVETLKKEVSDKEKNIEKTEQDITKTKESIEKRKASMANRMQTMQMTSNDSSILSTLLSSESVSDLVSRAYAISVLQTAQKDKINRLNSDRTKLEDLKSNLELEKESLATTQATVEADQAALEQQVSELKQTLADNQEALNRIAEERAAEAKRLKEEAEAKAKQEAEAQKAKEAKEAKEAQAAREQVDQPAPQPAAKNDLEPNAQSSVPVEPKPEPTPTPPTNATQNGGGRTMTMQSTAYSYSEPSCGFFTATGLDLRQNSRVIAVDPNVIPLNSLVEVSGYGYAIAADTGGAIKGNIIDVHFNTVAECINWGRRTVTVTVK